MNYEDCVNIKGKEGFNASFDKIKLLSENRIEVSKKGSPNAILYLSNIAEIHFWQLNWKFHIEIDKPTIEKLEKTRKEHYLHSFFAN